MALPMIVFCDADQRVQQSYPDPATARSAGQWSGITAQGKPVTFTISSDEKNVTPSATKQINSLVPHVQCIPAPCSNQLLSHTGRSAISAGDPGRGAGDQV